MINFKIGQKFKSKSKIQNTPVEYIFKGFLENGSIFIKATSNNPLDDCEVEQQWFKERRIIRVD